MFGRAVQTTSPAHSPCTDQRPMQGAGAELPHRQCHDVHRASISRVTAHRAILSTQHDAWYSDSHAAPRATPSSSALLPTMMESYAAAFCPHSFPANLSHISSRSFLFLLKLLKSSCRYRAATLVAAAPPAASKVFSSALSMPAAASPYMRYSHLQVILAPSMTAPPPPMLSRTARHVSAAAPDFPQRC
jgi:hypothetical protein